MAVLSLKCRDCGTEQAEAQACPVCGGQLAIWSDDLQRWVTPVEAAELRKPRPAAPAPPPAVRVEARRPPKSAVVASPIPERPVARKGLRAALVGGGALLGMALLVGSVRWALRTVHQAPPVPAQPPTAQDLALSVLAVAGAPEADAFQGAMTRLEAASPWLPQVGNHDGAKWLMKHLQSHLRRAQWEEADRDFAEARRRDPSDRTLPGKYAEGLLQARNYSRARALALEAVILEPRNPRAWSLYALATASLGWEADGTLAFLAAMRICPSPERPTLLRELKKASKTSPGGQRSLHAMTTRWKIAGL